MNGTPEIEIRSTTSISSQSGSATAGSSSTVSDANCGDEKSTNDGDVSTNMSINPGTDGSSASTLVGAQFVDNEHGSHGENSLEYSNSTANSNLAESYYVKTVSKTVSISISLHPRSNPDQQTLHCWSNQSSK